MPLLVLCGPAGGGRSRRAEELRRALEASGQAVHVVGGGDEDRDDEAGRGALRAAVERHLSRRHVLIVDAPNGVKGFRYELHCLARAAATRYCLLHCPARPEAARPEAAPFEAPDPRRRWERPLFTAPGPGGPLAAEVLRAVCAALLDGPGPPPPRRATGAPPPASDAFLHRLDRDTGRVLAALAEAQRGAAPGDPLPVPGAAERLAFTRPLGPAELARLRRQFISHVRTRPRDHGQDRFADMFLRYLRHNLA